MPPFDPLRGYDYVSDWVGLCRGGLDVVEVDSDHASLLKAPAVERIARELSAWLAAAQGAGA